jgi:hypothetical protein
LHRLEGEKGYLIHAAEEANRFSKGASHRVWSEHKDAASVFIHNKEMRIVFEFDHGHVEASNVKITESASAKTTKFYLSGRDGQMGTGKIRFAPVKGAKKEVLLDMDPFGDPLSPIKGSYTVAGKTVPFTLTKRKKH